MSLSCMAPLVTQMIILAYVTICHLFLSPNGKVCEGRTGSCSLLNPLHVAQAGVDYFKNRVEEQCTLAPPHGSNYF